MLQNIQEIDMVTLVKEEGEEYVFLYDIKKQTEMLKCLGRFASNPELSFTWYDAAILWHRIQQNDAQNMQ
jgi:hypothetical protein